MTDPCEACYLGISKTSLDTMREFEYLTRVELSFGSDADWFSAMEMISGLIHGNVFNLILI